VAYLVTYSVEETIMTIFITEHEESDLHLVIVIARVLCIIIIITTIMIGTMIIVIFLLLQLQQAMITMTRTPRTALLKLIIDNFE
jgi:hypothetical protein